MLHMPHRDNDDDNDDDDDNVDDVDYSLKEAKFVPCENVKRKPYLYVRVVQAKDLLAKDDITCSCNPYVEVRLGNYKGTTRHYEKKPNPEWNQVFAFSRDGIQDTVLEVTVKDKDASGDDFMGWVLYDLCVAPKRVPPDSPLASQWYRLEDRRGNKVNGEVMLGVWLGTEADEAFSDAASVSVADAPTNIRSKVYISPRLWYLRVNVIEVQDLITSDKNRSPESFVKVVLGNQATRTRTSKSRPVNPLWNEELMFVAAEPFDDLLIITVEDRVAPDKDEILGRCAIPLQYVDRRLDNRAIRSRWFNLERDITVEGVRMKENKFASRIHMRICLEGGYHVLDEPTYYCSDLRPTAKQLWKNSIGVLEVGILSAKGLSPMKTKDGRATTDAYCLAKYGTKWVRTRTIIDSCNPKWNEMYTWEVFDPCTVITIGVFDNCHLQGWDKGNGERDSRIGKVRIRLSTLETDRVCTHSYPLFDLHPSGVKRMGEIILAVRFVCPSLLNMMRMYSQPLLPKMHYNCPLTVTQLDSLRYRATQIVAMRLSRADPPLRREVVEYMLDVGCDMWSMRRSKANVCRIIGVFGGVIAVGKWLYDNCNWKVPVTNALIHILFYILLLHRAFILPSLFLSLFIIGVWNYIQRPMSPPHMDTRLSCADNTDPDELEEEFDTFPTSRPRDVISMRYDRLRSESGRIQTAVGDLASQGERLQSLLSWRDPRATTVFVSFCLIAAIVLYATPFHVVVVQTVLSLSNHPKNKLHSVPINFFRRLPPRTDCML